MPTEPSPPPLRLLPGGTVEIGGTEGVLLEGLSASEIELLATLNRPGPTPDLTRAAASCGVSEERSRLIEATVRCHRARLREQSEPRLAPQGGLVVIDGSGGLTEEITTQLRRTTSATIRSGAYAAVAAELPVGRSRLAARPDVVVIVGRAFPTTEHSLPWHQLGVTQLPVVSGPAGTTVGPVLAPGVGSCARCVHLTVLDLEPHRALPHHLTGALRPEHPLDTDPRTRALAGAVTAYVVDGVLRGEDDLVGISVDIGPDGPQLTHRYWPPHPRCPCSDTPDGGAAGDLATARQNG